MAAVDEVRAEHARLPLRHLRRVRRVAPQLALIAVVVGFGVLGWSRRWVTDDAFIDLRVVRHLVAGKGPVFNPPQRVEVYSNPLWVFALAFLSWLTSPLGARLEWIAVVVGLLCALAGLLSAGLAALSLARAQGRDRLALPLGALAFAALPVAWDFATSGLETGLGFGWLGVSWALLVRVALDPHRASTSRRARLARFAVAVFLGLGPLVRPDLGVFAIAFVVALAALLRPRARDLIALVLAAIALPAGYQLFRMGYFAALVPNSAIAKESALSRWSVGLAYLVDFGSTYALVVPLVALVVAAILVVVDAPASTRRATAWLVLAPIVAALAHATYVVRVGGDFMHGRLLLPSLFAAIAPVAVVGLRRRAARVAVALVVVPWAVVCAARLRWRPIGDRGWVVDERAFYSRHAGVEHPITVSDYRGYGAVVNAARLREAARVPRLVVAPPDALDRAPDDERPLAARAFPLSREAPAPIVAQLGELGLHGYAGGDRLDIVDIHGLSDPLTSRLEATVRRRPGHEKMLPAAWLIARFADPRVVASLAPDERAAVEDARAALGCGPIAELLAAVDAPLDASRFVRNLLLSPRLTALRIPADPAAARRRFCE